MTREEIEQVMFTIKGGEFPEWYASLTKEEQDIYSDILSKLRDI